MGLFGNKKETAPQNTVKKQTGTFIAPGIIFDGDFETEETIEVQGTVKGSIKSTGEAHIAETGKHIGKMSVNTLRVDGEVNSDVVCADVAILSETALFKGTLKTSKLDAAYGSSFEGKLSLENIKGLEPGIGEQIPMSLG